MHARIPHDSSTLFKLLAFLSGRIISTLIGTFTPPPGRHLPFGSFAGGPVTELNRAKRGRNKENDMNQN